MELSLSVSLSLSLPCSLLALFVVCCRSINFINYCTIHLENNRFALVVAVVMVDSGSLCLSLCLALCVAISVSLSVCLASLFEFALGELKICVSCASTLQSPSRWSRLEAQRGIW